jgi:hypothetical protein
VFNAEHRMAAAVVHNRLKEIKNSFAAEIKEF